MSMQMEGRFRGRGIWQLQLMKLKAAILELIMLAVVPYASGQAPVPSVIQHAAKDCGSATSCPVTLPAGSVQDNMIVAFARLGGHGIHAGIHWRSDSDVSMVLGEAAAISFLQDQAETFNEKFTVHFTKLDGTIATISNQ